MANDNEDMRLIVTKRAAYLVPVSASMTWQQRHPDSPPLKGYEHYKFWPTPEGLVFARPEDENPAS